MKKVLLQIGFLIMFIIGIIACNKQSVDQEKISEDKKGNKIEVVLKESPFKSFSNLNQRSANTYSGGYGQIDRSLSSSAERESGRLKLILSPLSRSSYFRRYVEIVDYGNGRSTPDTATYYFESQNLSPNPTQNEVDNFNGELLFICLDTGDQTLYTVQNGTKTGIQRYLSPLNGMSQARQSHWQCVRGCVNHTMDDMSWGETILCAATFPECCAGVFLACEIDCTIN